MVEANATGGTNEQTIAPCEADEKAYELRDESKQSEAESGISAQMNCCGTRSFMLGSVRTRRGPFRDEQRERAGATQMANQPPKPTDVTVL